MNILICTDDLKIINGYTLVPRYLAKELRKIGINAIIFCTSTPKNLMDGEENEDFIKFKSLNLIFNKKSIIEEIEKFKPDVIAANGIGIIDILAVNYGKKNKIPTITTLHTRIKPLIKEIVPFPRFWPGFLINFIQSFIFRLLKKSDIVIALSPEMKEYLYSIGLNNVEIISNGVDLNKFIVKPAMSKDIKVFNLLYVGNIEKRKNQKYLLEVSKYLPENVIINLVGGESWDKNYFKSFMDEYDKVKDIQKNIIFHGRIDQSKINEIYLKSDIFIAATLMEAQSLVFIEALVSGLPIIRLAGRHNQGVTDHLYNAIHLPEKSEPKLFAKSIMSVVNNYELYIELYTNAIKERENYSWEKNAKRFKNLLSYYISMHK